MGAAIGMNVLIGLTSQQDRTGFSTSFVVVVSCVQ